MTWGEDEFILSDYIANPDGTIALSAYDDPSLLFNNMTPEDHIRVGLFDFIMGNVDRHEANIVFPDGGFNLIDHGRIFLPNIWLGEYLSPIGSYNLVFPDVAGHLQDMGIEIEESELSWTPRDMKTVPTDDDMLDWARDRAFMVADILYNGTDLERESGTQFSWDFIENQISLLGPVSANSFPTWGDVFEYLEKVSHGIPVN